MTGRVCQDAENITGIPRDLIDERLVFGVMTKKETDVDGEWPSQGDDPAI